MVQFIDPLLVYLLAALTVLKSYGDFIVKFFFTIGFTSAQTCNDSNNRLGNCVNLARCPHLLEEFYEQTRRFADPVDFQTFVSQSICGFDGFNFLICCTIRPTGGSSQPHQQYLASSSLFHFAALGGQDDSSALYSSVTSASPQYTTQKTVQVVKPTTPVPPPAYPSQSLIINPVPGGEYLTTPSSSIALNKQNECGVSKSSTNRVVGGAEAKIGAYPWIAALGHYNEQNMFVFSCGGSLISRNYVVTAAHCNMSKIHIARLGAHDLGKEKEPNCVDLKIKNMIFHKDFDTKTFANDIALVQLDSPVAFTEFIRPICLPESEIFKEKDFVGNNPFVAGWGAMQFNGQISNVLRDAQVPVVRTKECMENYTHFTTTTKLDSVICAGNSRVDACQGDSGGPLMMPMMEQNAFRYYMLGIVSYGNKCAFPGYPGVYTRAAFYIDWIKENML